MTLRFGRYETIAPIATGGMATVYLGKAVGAGGFERRVAIKVMHPHIADDPEFLTMFLDEARLAARIHHPNVVGTIDVQKTEESMFLVMEYIEGCSLRDILRPLRKVKARMPIGNALRILIDALAGLHAAHELTAKDGSPLDLVHRDVSPHNILVGADGISKITDFGVARASARLTSTRGGQLKGKIAYMPPEQGRGDAVDRRADVYAAGVVLWEALVGRRLFRAEHDGALVAMVLAGATIPPREVVAFVPEEIDAVCMKALAGSPTDRFASAAEFADALEEAAREAQVRIPTARQLAGFVHKYKVEIKSVPPPPKDKAEKEAKQPGDDESPPEPMPSDSGRTNKEWPRTGEGEPGTSPQASDGQAGDAPENGDARSSTTGTSQLSKISAVRSQDDELPKKRQPTVVLAGAAAAAVLLIIFVAVLARSGDDPDPATQGVPTSAPTGAAEVPATESPTEPTATATPTADPSATATSTSSNTESDAPPVDSAEPATSASSGGPRPGPYTGGKGRGNGPLGYEPDDL
ncbi:MAG: protein kinase [Deltaproteobacteria bacterium]|nr:protein kinase [Deltaproteobacteria bacterium]